MRNFVEDEGRPLEVGVQAQASNHLKLRGSRARVVSVEVKRRSQLCQVGRQETNESEALMKCRKTSDDVKTGSLRRSQEELGGRPVDCPSGIRHVGGVK